MNATTCITTWWMRLGVWKTRNPELEPETETDPDLDPEPEPEPELKPKK